MQKNNKKTKKFLSTLSLRRATGPMKKGQVYYINFYPRSPCGERLHYDNYNLHCVEISIHALLAESDLYWSCRLVVGFLFLSTLSLRRATFFSTNTSSKLSSFLSTLSLRRATSAARLTPTASRNFYPRSPCGERRCQHRSHQECSDFYPRSPCGERLSLYVI